MPSMVAAGALAATSFLVTTAVTATHVALADEQAFTLPPGLGELSGFAMSVVHPGVARTVDAVRLLAGPPGPP